MSSGVFEDGKYISNAGDIYPCRAQPESKALALGGVSNAYPAAATDQPNSARLKSSNKRIGVNGRSVRVQLTASLADYKADAILTVPVFQASVWEGYSKGQVGTYQGTAVKFVGKSPESIK